MKILALILARGGSKRLPGKNIRLLGNKPLIVWSIDIVKGIEDICDTLVSTDDMAILQISKDAGAYVPWLRPAELATDTATSVDAALHALNWYEDAERAVDGVLLLQPTSPFRSKETICNGIRLFKTSGRQAVVGVTPTDAHPMWAMKIENNHLVSFMAGDGLKMRSQDLPPAYVVNGGFYLISPQELRECHSFYSENIVPLIMPAPQEALDIDTEWDWAIAETALIWTGLQ